MPLIVAARRPAFDWTVKLTRPDPAAAGRHATTTFTARFQPPSPEEEEAAADPLLSRLEASLRPEELNTVEKARAAVRQAEEAQKDVLRRVWVGWGPDVMDEDRQPLPFDEAARERLLAERDIRKAVLAAYGEAMNPGNPKGARAGN